jgi:hypothetical protein
VECLLSVGTHSRVLDVAVKIAGNMERLFEFYNFFLKLTFYFILCETFVSLRLGGRKARLSRTAGETFFIPDPGIGHGLTFKFLFLFFTI